jgi:hypothetical protein
MLDYHINDEWILDRISNKSESFDSWLSNLLASVEKNIEDIDAVVFNEIGKGDQITKSKVKNEINKAKASIAKTKKDLPNLGSLGNTISSITSKAIQWVNKKIENQIEEKFIFSFVGCYERTWY